MAPCGNVALWPHSAEGQQGQCHGHGWVLGDAGEASAHGCCAVPGAVAQTKDGASCAWASGASAAQRTGAQRHNFTRMPIFSGQIKAARLCWGWRRKFYKAVLVPGRPAGVVPPQPTHGCRFLHRRRSLPSPGRHFNCFANYALSWTFKVIKEEEKKKKKKKGKQRGCRCAKAELSRAGMQRELRAIPPCPILAATPPGTFASRLCHFNSFGIFVPAPLSASPRTPL